MLQTAGKYVLVAVFVFFAFVGGRLVERHEAYIRLRPPAPLPAGILKRCGDSKERACRPGELSDNDLRGFCIEGRVSAELMRGRGFDAHDGVNGHCELSLDEQDVFLHGMVSL